MLRANGSRLGVKKTLGKVSQPINAASRCPQYRCVDTAGSPKLSERRAAPFIARVMSTATSFWPA
jgi:hypothetical protein